ncbi:uncharacterized protein [Eurosta solidaginis]|uniref:uncharacterized protein n=1 Tax=Eurosta solidaginis TaxID=178769 RepID=UPI00353166DC
MSCEENSINKGNYILNGEHSSTNGEHSSTSEVRWIPPEETSNECWRALLESQNRNFQELIRAMHKPNIIEPKVISLPKFNPDSPGADPISWCTTVDMIFAENSLVGSALIISLSKALEGGASQWLSQVCFAGITWQQFKDLFVQRFVGVETPAAALIHILNGRPSDGECLSLYGSRLVTSLVSRWKSMNIEEIAVSVVLAHTAQFDNRLQRLLFTTDMKTRNELQQNLQAFAFGKRKESSTFAGSTYPENKKSRLSTVVKCHYCGKTGHKIADCRLKRNNVSHASRGNQLQSSSSLERKRPTITCFKCGEAGHVATVCPKGSSTSLSGIKENSYGKKVNLCAVAEPKDNHEDV